MTLLLALIFTTSGALCLLGSKASGKALDNMTAKDGFPRFFLLSFFTFAGLFGGASMIAYSLICWTEVVFLK